MKKFQFNAIAGLLCAGAVASGAFVTNVAAADTTREQRMEQALQSYRGAPANNNASTNDASRRGYRDGTQAGSGTGRFARAEESVKRGVKKGGKAVADTGRRAGKAVAEGGRKAKRGVRNAGESVSRKMGVTPNPNAGAETK